MLGRQEVPDTDVKLNELGFDSLLALEFKNIVSKELKIDIGIQSLMEGISIKDLTNVIFTYLTIKRGIADKNRDLIYMDI